MPELKLNQAQKEAIEYTDGPLLIVAGAGTGKTTVITEKISYLIEKKLAKPEEILAVTFTEKAAEEMEERVDKLLDIGYVDLQISTFHSFCQRILEEYALDIGLPNQFNILTPTDTWLLIRENLNKFNLDYYRPLGNPTRYIHELIKHFSKCKDELISPEEYLNYAEEVKLDKDEVNKNERSRLTEIANAYHVYNQILLDNNALDFGDLIHYTIKLLQERPQILQALQKRFKYILVDEFQDVNWAQYQLVRLLADKESQLTVVGDDDQAVYSFRGASVSNILRFKDDYDQAKEIILTENYRSGQAILDLAYKLIQNNNPDRLEAKLKIDKKLKTESKITAEIHHLHARTLDGEVATVIQNILKLKKEGISWDDFAILVRANSHTQPFVRALEQAQIPYEFLASSGLYRQEIVLDCLNFFKAIDSYHESSAIYRLLQLPFLNFSIPALQKLTYFAKKKSISYYEALGRAQEAGVAKDMVTKTDKLISLLQTGRQQARSQKPIAILLDFLETSGYTTYLTHEEETGNREVIRQIHQLNQFFIYLRRYEETLPEARISNFVEHFKYVLDSGDEGSLLQPSDTPDSVNILTIHGAKGLEFKYVFIVNLVEEQFPTRKRGEAIEIPLTLVKEKLPEGDFHYQEERRLFYVAMTRAKEKLFLTSGEDYGGVRKKKLSRFLDELGYNNEVSLEKLEIKKQVSVADEQTIIEYETPDKFSFSQINSYQRCPYQYKLAHILHVPTKGKPSFSFGQSIHLTLQKFYQRIQELNSAKQDSLFAASIQEIKTTGGVKVPELEELLEIYEASWLEDWYQSKKQREEYFKKGKEILKIFYAAQKDNWTIPVALEGWFKVKVGDYLIHGKIDRVDKLADGSLEIIDYKTGKAKEKIIGDDKNQLLIYQMAVQTLPEYKNIGEVGKLTFFYLEGDIQTSFMGADKELVKLQEKIVKTIQEIEKQNFTATPGPYVCGNCDFRDICEFRRL